MGHGVRRRDLLRGGLGLSLVAAVDSKLSPTLHAQDNPAAMRPKPGDFIVRDDDAAKTPLTPGDIVADARPTVAWAMDPAEQIVRSASRFNRLAVVRIGDDVYAHTVICTHDGCDVTDWFADEHVLICPCHYSKFDPKDGGRVTGGPAPRALPQLPLVVTDGKLVVSRPFTSKVGFESQ